MFLKFYCNKYVTWNYSASCSRFSSPYFRMGPPSIFYITLSCVLWYCPIFALPFRQNLHWKENIHSSLFRVWKILIVCPFEYFGKNLEKINKNWWTDSWLNCVKKIRIWLLSRFNMHGSNANLYKFEIYLQFLKLFDKNPIGFDRNIPMVVYLFCYLFNNCFEIRY